MAVLRSTDGIRIDSNNNNTWGSRTYTSTRTWAAFQSGRASLNTNGQISHDAGWDWHAWGGNGILWPYLGMGGSSLFIGANSGMSTGVVGSVWFIMCTLAFDNITVNVFSD